jgi:hypothetical protein
MVPFGASARTAPLPKNEWQLAIQRVLQQRREGLSLRAISAEGVKLSHEGVKNVLASGGATAA